MRREARFHKVAVLHTKGGCGKTTLATNLASAFATAGPPPTLLDHDPNGFAMRWLEKRPVSRHEIVGVSVDEATSPREANRLVDPQSNLVIADLPAGLSLHELYLHVHDADSILIPVLPSEIDMYSTTRFIHRLLLDVQFDANESQLGIVANRVRRNTNSYVMLSRFLARLEIPVVATLRDSQSFVQAAARGLGIFDLAPHRVRPEREAMTTIVNWVDRRRLPQLDLQDLHLATAI
ncbi:MAG: ParA family protein [Gammaproteobacteria bacterium]|nr:ParA family protein [Gammaproteobacteria bacterium]